jgi:hypothetical protein
MKSAGFWVVMLCGMVEIYLLFGETCFGFIRMIAACLVSFSSVLKMEACFIQAVCNLKNATVVELCISCYILFKHISVSSVHRGTR